MATADKIYGTREQHKEFYEWCEENFPPAIHQFYDADAMDKNSKIIPLTNFSYEIDLWMIENCPIEFVQDRLKEQYDYDKLDEIELNHCPYCDKILYTVPVKDYNFMTKCYHCGFTMD